MTSNDLVVVVWYEIKLDEITEGFVKDTRSNVRDPKFLLTEILYVHFNLFTKQKKLEKHRNTDRRYTLITLND